MKIFHYILTGIDFAETRNKWNENTWLKRIGPNDDYIFIEGKSDSSRKVFGSDTLEQHKGFNNTNKLQAFYLHVYFNWHKYRKYDWFMFSDSDCYIYVDRLRKFLKDFNCESPLFIGRINVLEQHPGNFEGDTNICQISKFLKKDKEVPWGPFVCHNGGSGWVLNKKAMIKLCAYIYCCISTFYIRSDHYDLSNALWLNDCDIPMLHSRLFRTEPYHRLKEYADYIDDNVITLHYMEEKDFYYVDSKL